jgi:hypothetical protein
MTFLELLGLVFFTGVMEAPPAPSRRERREADRREYEALCAGGVRAMLEQSSLRYDVAIYVGGLA